MEKERNELFRLSLLLERRRLRTYSPRLQAANSITSNASTNDLGIIQLLCRPNLVSETPSVESWKLGKESSYIP